MIKGIGKLKWKDKGRKQTNESQCCYLGKSSLNQRKKLYEIWVQFQLQFIRLQEKRQFSVLPSQEGRRKIGNINY